VLQKSVLIEQLSCTTENRIFFVAENRRSYYSICRP